MNLSGRLPHHRRFAQLCALIGDHRTESVSEAATKSLIHLVAWLGERHDIDTASGSDRLPDAATELRQVIRNQLDVHGDETSSDRPTANQTADAGAMEPPDGDGADPGEPGSFSIGPGTE